MTTLAKRICQQESYNANITSTTDRREALNNADFVILMIQTGGLEAYNLDIAIPRKYGIDQAVGDTLGPGGIFRALRTIPVLLDICRDMEEICPEALLLNYVNPMAINCWAISRAMGGIKTIGLCHSVQGTSEDIAKYISAHHFTKSHLNVPGSITCHGFLNTHGMVKMCILFYTRNTMIQKHLIRI
jgi:alpha-galactosidase